MYPNISKFLFKSQRYLKRRAPAILTCISACGVIITAVSAAKATPKYIFLKERAEDEKGEELTGSELFRIRVGAYMPTILFGTATIGCIFGANALNRQKQAILASAYSMVNHSYQQYRETLIDLHGEEADVEVRNVMARTQCNYHQIGLDVPDGKVIFYDELSGETFVRYEREVMDAEYHLNRNFVLRGYASLNEFYRFLGLPETNLGEVLGWTCTYGYSWIDFEHRLITRDDGGPDIYAIDMVFGPDDKYLADWE